MSKLKAGASGQLSLGALGTGSVVRLDGGTRIRLDDKVDYWPATGAWVALVPAEHGGEPASGVGMSAMLGFLRRERERAGQPVRDPVPLPSERRVTCNYCMRVAELHNGPAVYPDRKDLEGRQFWVCWPCDAWVGCHSGTDRPFGELANEELRHARIAAHKTFDPVWEKGRVSRPEAYAWLCSALGLTREQCQIGLLSVEDCRRVRELVWERFESLDDSHG